MEMIRLFARLLCTAGIFIAGVYTALAIVIAFFIVNGTLVPGAIMFYDSHTPSLSQTLQFAGVGSIIVCGLAYARGRLRPLLESER